MWELDYKQSWEPKNWCFWTVVLEKTLFFFFSLLSIYFIFFYFYFILLYNTVLVLPYIVMNQPQVFMSSQSWTTLPPPPSHPERFTELHGEEKMAGIVRGDWNEMRWDQKRREQRQGCLKNKESLFIHCTLETGCIKWSGERGGHWSQIMKGPW